MSEARYTLLFVDDEPDVLDILTKTFERSYEVLSAPSGVEALAILKARPIDLLITDQRMPEMKGIELISAARAAGIDVTSILLTAYTDPEDLISAINEGRVYRFVTKPWDVNDLLITVRQALQYTQLRRDKDRLLHQMRKRVDALSVLYEVSQQSANDAPTYDAMVERVLAAVQRVLPYDAGAALVAVDEGRSASLRIRINAEVAEKGLLWIQETVLGAHRKHSGRILPDDRVIARVTGGPGPDARAPGAGAASSFASQLSVPLLADGGAVGTLSLFSRQPGVYTAEDGELLDVLANQTTAAIQALRASEDVHRRRMERMVESMADGVLLTDEKNEIVVINPAARTLLKLGDDPKEWTSRHLQETLGFYPFELVRGWEYGGAQVLQEELRIYDRTIQSTVSPVVGKGALRGVVVVLRDITEQRLLEERKEEFVSIISHELRTPLTSISGAIDLVLNGLAGDINDKQQRYLGMAKDSTEKLNAIVDDLLDLAKYAKGRMKMTFEVTHLDELVKAAVEKYAPPMMEKQIHVDLRTPATPLTVVADPGRLTQVLNNLLTNAVKFTPEGGSIQVELLASAAAPGFAALAVENSGDPIAEADLERIFDKFEQARNARTRTVSGTGLGLAISRSIAEAHGGRIWAEPVLRGARFVMVLPVEPTAEVLEGVPEQPAPPAGLARTASVLLVEDDPEVAYVLKAMLMSRHHRVLIAGTAEEALSLARRYRPDVMAVDFRLPDIDGFHLAEIFRNDPDTRHAPILVLSALDERQRALRLGVDAFLQKPLYADKFLATLDALIRGKAGRRGGRVLAVDDDDKIRDICREVLANIGFEVDVAGSLAEARRKLSEKRPDVMLLDVMLPDGDGFSFLEELKAERASRNLSVIFVSARAETQAKVRALKLGGDDYLTKPFDALELGARVEAVIRRKEQEQGWSPTTQLPGSAAIEREVQRRLQARQPFAFCYLDLDNLKAFNDYYGYAKADGVIRQTGDLLREIISLEGRPDDFLGHVAGDDFVFVTDPSSVDRVCQRAIESFDRIIPLYYDRTDRERGHIEAEDRFGQRRQFPVMSVSIVAVMSDGVSTGHAELARVAAEMKKRAKAIQGSVYLRSDREPAARSVAG